MTPPRPGEDLRLLAERLVRAGLDCGADEIEVSVGDDVEFGVDVRLGEIENLVEAASRSAGFRVIKDRKTATASSSDLNPATLDRLIRNAVRRAEMSSPDEWAGLPAAPAGIVDPSRLEIYDPEIPALDPRKKIERALETERIGMADRRITNSHGANYDTHVGRSVLASSNGFIGEYHKTYAELSLGLQAGETDDLVEDFWFSSHTHLAPIASPEEIARVAIARTVRGLHPRKIATQRVPVIFEPMTAAGLLGFLFSCVAGPAVYQKSTFLGDRLGQRIGNDRITVIDDGLLPRRLGTSPFDSEGVPCRRTKVVENGILKTFLCNTYAARRLGLSSTGSADGGGVGPGNFFLQPGPHSPTEIIRSVKKGLLVTRTLGHGLNPVTGDLSRGAFGLWIENGEIAYAVAEITISGNLGEILKGVEMVGDDLDFTGSICAPTIKIAELQVSGR